MLKDFTPRLYQETIFATTSSANTLVVLPTGMGKTALALLLAANRLEKFPDYKILIMAPTKPLCEQHINTFKKQMEISEDKIVLFTGHVSPSKRELLWKDAKIIVSTPQGIENDIISRRIDISKVSLAVFDEAHKAVGDYAYVFIAEQYRKLAKHERILALTASPGDKTEKVIEICDNLSIDDLEIRTEDDPDVKPYIQDVKINWVKVEFPQELKKMHSYLMNAFVRKIKAIQALGMFKEAVPRSVTRTHLIKFQAQIYAQVSQGHKDYDTLRVMSLLAEVMKLSHAIELVETQGVHAAYPYLKGIQNSAGSSKVKAVQNLARDVDFRSALIVASNLFEEGVKHPKIEKIKKIIEENKNKKIIVFTHFRDTGAMLAKEIDGKLFVGQAKKNGNGLSQKEQKKMLEDFRNKEFNILVSTSVGEEGLDIPQVDLVVFYEPIPSAIRTVQRRGRTGRLASGKVITLMTKGTRDEGYRWSAHHKEKRMKRILKDIKSKINMTPKREKTLSDFSDENVKIYADTREKGSKIIKNLMSSGILIELSRLDVGDYIVSDRCAIEFKTIVDFVDSLVDGRMLTQIKMLKENYLRPIIIVEGDADIYSQRGVHPNSIRGMLATIMVSYGVPVYFTKNPHESVQMMITIARREQSDGRGVFNPHFAKKNLSIKDSQEYIMSAFPSVGPSVAKKILEKFGSLDAVFRASLEELCEVDGVGKTIAKNIKTVASEKYK